MSVGVGERQFDVYVGVAGAGRVPDGFVSFERGGTRGAERDVARGLRRCRRWGRAEVTVGLAGTSTLSEIGRDSVPLVS
jgi:hypothetical protein